MIRGWILPILSLLSVGFALWGLVWPPARWGLAVTVPFFLLGLHDLLQRRHSLLRTYPVLGHLRFLLEDAGPELRQYIVEHNTEGRPFNRDQRSLMYQRAKGVVDKKAFGTELDVYAAGYGWIAHSMAPRSRPETPERSLRVEVGGPDCSRPYRSSVFNVSGMSFGALSSNAIRALNEGAKRGGFSHNTGEGGVSRHHREPGGDLVWQVGTGYFGCRDRAGVFDAERFREQAALESVRMIEVKLSQGAKPGHGGVLPAAKISREIAEARGIEPGVDCISPPYHTAFSDPIGLLDFVGRLRELAEGKPVGLKLAVGDPLEWMSVCRAMVETGISPDFVTVDGAEGGTGAAPIEFSDHIGMPVREGVVLVHNSLVGIGLRERVRIFASAKLVTAYEMASVMALGADAINSARGFMFALGCIQAQRCHTNSCPVGVATQDPWLSRALVTPKKALRVENFHRSTVRALAGVVAAAGLEHPGELEPRHVYQRVSSWDVRPLDSLYPSLPSGQLLESSGGGFLRHYWDAARADRFQPQARRGRAAAAGPTGTPELLAELRHAARRDALAAGPEGPAR